MRGGWTVGDAIRMGLGGDVGIACDINPAGAVRRMTK